MYFITIGNSFDKCTSNNHAISSPFTNFNNMFRDATDFNFGNVPNETFNDRFNWSNKSVIEGGKYNNMFTGTAIDEVKNAGSDFV